MLAQSKQAEVIIGAVSGTVPDELDCGISTLGVIGLVGILQVTVSPEQLSYLFRGNSFLDTLTGTLAGSVAAGNPIVSYILGGELLERGVSLYAVTVFLLSWVTLGFIHLPVEKELFGGRFTLFRNCICLACTMLIALATAATVQVLS